MQTEPTTANRYYLQDEFGEILAEADDLDVILRIKARLQVVEGRRVRMIDRRTGDELN